MAPLTQSRLAFLSCSSKSITKNAFCCVHGVLGDPRRAQKCSPGKLRSLLPNCRAMAEVIRFVAAWSLLQQKEEKTMRKRTTAIAVMLVGYSLVLQACSVGMAASGHRQ